jgi:hypothetical protein
MRHPGITAALVAAGLVVAAGGCSRPTSHHEVRIEGLPSCAAGSVLQQPLVVELVAGDTTARLKHFGTPSAGSIGIPEGETAAMVRVGRCRATDLRGKVVLSADCERPEWLGPAESLPIRAGAPHARLSVSAPGDHPCWGP